MPFSDGLGEFGADVDNFAVGGSCFGELCTLCVLNVLEYSDTIDGLDVD